MVGICLFVCCHNYISSKEMVLGTGTQTERAGCPVNGDPTRSIFDKEGSFRCICTSLGEDTSQLPWQSGECQDDFAQVSFSGKSPGICRVVTGREVFTMGFIPQKDNVCKIVSQDQNQESPLLDVLCYERVDQMISQLPNVFPPGDPSGEIQDIQIDLEGNTVAIRFWYLDDSFTSQGFFSVYERNNEQSWEVSATREIPIEEPLLYGSSYMSMDGLGSTIAIGDDNADKLFLYEKGPLTDPWTVQTILASPTVPGEFEPLFLFGRQPVLNSGGDILVTAGTSLSYDYAVVYKKEEEGSWKKEPSQFFSPGSVLGATELDYIGITAMDISGDGKHVVIACNTVISGDSDGSTNVILYKMDEVTGRYGSPTQIFVRQGAFGLVDQVTINNDGTRVVIGGALLDSILVLTIGVDPTVVERTDEFELQTSIYSSLL